MFCANTSRDQVTLTFDLLTLTVVLHIQGLSCPTHIQILICYDYLLLKNELLNLIAFPFTHVTYHRGEGKNGPHF